MKNVLLATLAFALISFSSCITPAPIAAPGAPAATNDGSRNFVLIMHGESCNSENVASNMYCENSHETKSISVTVDVTWTENNQPQHQNMTVAVSPKW